MGAMNEAEEQRRAWGVQWDTGKPRREPSWPTTVAGSIPDLTIQAFVEVCMTFPCQTGLGWDNIHPRALARLPRSLLLQLVLCLLAAETIGQWPSLAGWVVIVLLPKPDGGRRPIGLIPCLPRVWSWARREIASKWEEYLYGGAGKGAEVAAWRQAARSELVAMSGKEYAQGLLDLVKAYERIPHWILLREAQWLGYPIWLLRLQEAPHCHPGQGALELRWTVLMSLHW